MQGVVYVNGEYVEASQARISIFDRGFLFADAVYEVSSVLKGSLVDNQAHLARLKRSLDAIEMSSPISDAGLIEVQQELIRANKLEEGTVYLQITRGPADRDFAYPLESDPTLIAFTQARALIDSETAARGISVITVPDIRWKRRDIKTVGLLAPSMAKQAAKAQGADDAWMHENGFVTEGSSNNAHIITSQNQLVTRNLGNEILSGITRAAILELGKQLGITIIEKPFTLEDAYNAQEAFITSASTFVCPVVKIDNHIIGDGKPGSIAKRLRALYIEMVLA